MCLMCLYAFNMNMWLSVNGYDYYVSTWNVYYDMIRDIWIQNDICDYMIENMKYDTCVWLHNGCYTRICILCLWWNAWYNMMTWCYKIEL